MPTRVTQMEFDENSFVDVPANQLGRILLTKAAGGTVPTHETETDQFEMVDVDELQVGDVIETDDGEQVELTQEMLDAISDMEPQDFAEEPEPVGKSDGFTDRVVSELRKAFDRGDRDEVVKAVAGQMTELQKRAERAEAIAKAEQDARLERDYTARAAQYGLPGVDPAVLGPVMKRAAELMPEQDCVILNKVFEVAGEAAEAAFTEIGKGYGSDPFGLMQDVAQTVDVSKADDVEAFFDANPEAYDEYEASQRWARG